MAVHSESGDCGPDLPGVVPFDLPHLSRLSWELGSRVVDDPTATREGEWEHVDGSWSLAAHRVTSATVVLRLTSPTGREHFYGTTERQFESVVPELDAAPRWRR